MEGQWTPVIPEPETEEAAETEAETSAAAAAKNGDTVKQAVSGPGEK